MIEIMALIAMCLPYIIYLYANQRRDNIEFQMIEHINEMKHIVKKGDSIETGLKIISEKKDTAARVIKNILLNSSDDLEGAFRRYADSNKSMAFTMISNVICSSGDAYSILKQAETELGRYRDVDNMFRKRVNSQIMAIQALGFLAVPYGIYLISAILGLEVPQSSNIYLLGVIVLFSLLDAIIKKDILESLFKLPFFISLYIISVHILVPRILSTIS